MYIYTYSIIFMYICMHVYTCTYIHMYVMYEHSYIAKYLNSFYSFYICRQSHIQ